MTVSAPRSGHRQRAELLADAAAYCHAWGVEAETDRIDGTAKANLLDYARSHHSDLIVLGNGRASLLDRRGLGPTTDHTIRHAELPLFLAH